MNEELSLIYNKALDILSRREHSSKELTQKLIKKFDNETLIVEVTHKLIANNLLNDVRFAEMYTLARKNKGFGPKKIFYELLTKGLLETDINIAIEEEGEWEVVAKKVFKKKFPNGKSDDIKIILKQKNFLINRGFSFKQIESVFANDMVWFLAMSYEVLARKYRPSNFEEVIGQDHVVKALVNSINSEKIHQAFIFSGTRGVGKTTIARILAKCLNCESESKPTAQPCNKCSNTIEISAGRSVDFLEIDAASNTQVEKMRDLIETVEYKPAKGRFKVYLIDEVHMLSTASFNALLKTLEEPPPHVVFIFATTNPEKIPKTVQSRCLQLNLKTVNENLLFEHLKNILDKEKIDSDDMSISLIVNSAQGSVRDALTLLDQAIAYGDGVLSEVDVKKLLGTIDNSLLMSMIDSVVDGNGQKVFDLLSQIEELSPSYDIILKDVISILHRVSLHQVLSNSASSEIANLANKVDKEFCQLLYEIAMNAYSKFNVHPDPKEALEICLLRMLTFNPLQKLSESNVPSSDEKKNLKINNLDSNEKPKKVKSIEPEPRINNNEIKNDNDWLIFFDSLEISPFARNYYGNMSFISHTDNKLLLMTDDSIGEVPENIESEFLSTLRKLLDKNIKIHYEKGAITNSPIETKEKKEKDDLNEAHAKIKNNESIQNFVKKFKGAIKEDTIKPLKWVEI